MSDQQKNEQPTQRRIDKARRDGQYPAAKELVGALQFLSFTAMLAWGAGWWFESIKAAARFLLGRAFAPQFGPGELVGLSAVLLWRVGLPLLLGGAALIVVMLAARLATTRMGLSLKKLSPDFKRLSPLARLKELPRQNLPALVQALVMLPLFGAAVYAIARDHLDIYLALPLAGVQSGVGHVASTLKELFWKAGGVFLAFGLIDLVRQQRRYRKDLRMSKQEIREEMKETEGNPQVKMRLRRLQRDLMRRRMMQEVPKATAVVVNPTHYAVAIRYEMDSMAAPKVVAKGKNYLALRIRQRAMEHQVPIVENPPLAQALYKSVDIGQEIPAHLYRAVAEILAYIYRLMNGRLPG